MPNSIQLWGALANVDREQMSLAGLPRAWPVAPTPEFVWTKQREEACGVPGCRAGGGGAASLQYWGDSHQTVGPLFQPLCVCARGAFLLLIGR